MEGSPTNALAGRVALITGAGSGFGRGCAISLASAGASVVVNDIVPEGADKTVAAMVANAGVVAAARTLALETGDDNIASIRWRLAPSFD